MFMEQGQQYGRKIIGNPYRYPSSNWMPQQLTSCWDVAQYLYGLNPEFGQACNRIIAHFNTSIEVLNQSNDFSMEKWREFKQILDYKVGIKNLISEIGKDYGAYGNAFVKVYIPFDRVLKFRKPDGNLMYVSLSYYKPQHVKFNLESMTYSAPDPTQYASKGSAAPEVTMDFEDRYDVKDVKRLKFILIPPNRVYLRYAESSDTYDVIERISETLVADVKRGALHQVNTTPREVLIAVRDSKDIMYAPGRVFHLKNKPISGMTPGGWGIPPTFEVFRSVHMLDLFKSVDEVLAHSQAHSYKIISPAATPGVQDSTIFQNMHLFKNQVQTMKNMRQIDPDAITAFAWPVTYQETGATAVQMSPTDKIKYQSDMMMLALGYPPELMSMSLQLPQIPTVLRIFEMSFAPLTWQLNLFVNWSSNVLSEFLGTESYDCGLEPPSMAADIEAKGMLVSLMQAGEISRERVLQKFGVYNYLKEFGIRLEEDAERQILTDEVQKKTETRINQKSVDDVIVQQQQAQAEQQQGAMPPGGGVPMGGGAPPAGGAPSGGTPIEAKMEQEAMATAERWLQLPDGQRSQDMQNIKANQPLLYAAAKQKMEEMRSQVRSQAVQQAFPG